MKISFVRGVMADLNTLVDRQDDLYTVVDATGINDSGWVVGVEEVHHLVVVLRGARLAAGGERGTVAAADARLADPIDP